ncbi:ABC transporter ATP-binding protein [Phytohabitans suffuscus]|uniref:ABC transporter ATP-binding protein n=1 Tax=Phytohabitans suffuscus TaxID=624315 RepID=A0A6F8YU69_9ACTN|nr:ABC transporter ATP-binding protein [Phytohabitans suffuscus]BCB89619.1 ABC transporter ATP-binding protein [Phytohabitans suffuscus]
MSGLLIEDLRVTIGTAAGPVHALRGVDLAIPPGTFLGLVGESGSGKSLTASAVLGMLPEAATVDAGRVLLDGADILKASRRELRRIRGSQVAAIFQNPVATLNPLIRVGDQIAELIRIHRGAPRRRAAVEAVDLLAAMGIAEPRRRARQYPHQYSGGMAQRAALARALACSPRLLIADEPTTGLDATVQAEVLALIVDRVRAAGASVLLITHDLAAAAQVCERVAVMHDGAVVEQGPTAQVLTAPRDPYTRSLIDSYVLAVDGDTPVEAR